MSDILGESWTALADIMGAHGPVVNGVKTFATSDYSIHFFLQLALIIATCRVVGWLGQKFLGQPQVVGEMIAGVLLGPSLFGL
ncbi:MAG TPA: cation:proton antiporter, partial [Sphingomicrobium sp.]